MWQVVSRTYTSRIAEIQKKIRLADMLHANDELAVTSMLVVSEVYTTCTLFKRVLVSLWACLSQTICFLSQIYIHIYIYILITVKQRAASEPKAFVYNDPMAQVSLKTKEDFTNMLLFAYMMLQKMSTAWGMLTMNS